MKKLPIILISIFVLLTLIALGGGVWAYFEFFHTKPLNETEMAELTPDWNRATGGNWSPWQTAAFGTQEWNPTAGFNNWLASVPEEDKAWPVLIDLAYGNPELFKHEHLGGGPSDSEQWAELVALMESPQGVETIDRLVDALGRPVMGCGLYTSTGTYEHQALLQYGFEDENWNPNPDPNPVAMDLLLPTLGKLRNGAKLLQSSAIHELMNDHPERFVELIEVMHGSATLAEENPVIIGQLVRIAVESVAADTVRWALEQYPDSFDDQQLLRLSNTLKQSPHPTFIWEGEALFFFDTLRHMVNANGVIDPAKLNVISGGGGNSTPSHLPDAQLDSSIQRLMFVYNNVLKQAEAQSSIPWDPALVSADEIYLMQKDSLNMLSQLFMDISLPAMDKASARFQGSAQESIGTRVVIALHRHRLRHGEFPATINDIDTDFLDFEPMDIFTGGQLQYQQTDQGPMVYALGSDRDDDGGWYAPRVRSIGSNPVDADWPMFSNSKLEELYPDD